MVTDDHSPKPAELGPFAAPEGLTGLVVSHLQLRLLGDVPLLAFPGGPRILYPLLPSRHQNQCLRAANFLTSN